MKKLLNLKQWLTIPEASVYLSIALDESVSDSDVLFFGLNNSLQLSVDLVNGAQARRGSVVDAHEVASELSRDEVVTLSSTSKLILDEELVYIRGIYELPLYGQELISLLSKFHADTNGPKVDLIAMNGAFVRRGADVYQLYDYFETMPRCVGSLAWHKAITDEAKNHPDEEKRKQAERLLSHYNDDRQNMLKHASEIPEWCKGCVPAHTIPEDSILMVHKNALDDLIKSAQTDSPESDSAATLAAKERSNYLHLVGALADMYWNEKHPNEDYKQAALLSDLEKYADFPGMRERNLKEKLTLAMRLIRPRG